MLGKHVSHMSSVTSFARAIILDDPFSNNPHSPVGSCPRKSLPAVRLGQLGGWENTQLA